MRLLAVVDGGELGSTARIDVKRDPLGPFVIRTKIVNVANDNYISEVRVAA